MCPTEIWRVHALSAVQHGPYTDKRRRGRPLRGDGSVLLAKVSQRRPGTRRTSGAERREGGHRHGPGSSTARRTCVPPRTLPRTCRSIPARTPASRRLEGDLFHVDAFGRRTFAFALQDGGQVLLDEGRVVGAEVTDGDVVELVVTRIAEHDRRPVPSGRRRTGSHRRGCCHRPSRGSRRCRRRGRRQRSGDDVVDGRLAVEMSARSIATMYSPSSRVIIVCSAAPARLSQ